MAKAPSQKVFDTDVRMYRKSTHLASVDVQIMEKEKGKAVLTIKEAWYQENVDVSGKPKDGIFCSFWEPGVKEMVLNSTNQKQIALFAKTYGFANGDEFNPINWKNIRIELYVDNKVKLKGEVVDGIRIKPLMPVEETKAKPVFTEDRFEKAAENGATIEQISKHYTVTEEIANKYNEYAGNRTAQ